MNGSKDWRPILRGVLGHNIVRKVEMLSRNVFLRGPKTYWTYADDGSGSAPTSFATLTSNSKFQLPIVDEWALRMGYTGTPIVPGDAAGAKVAMIPPGVRFDIMRAITASATASEAALFRDVAVYGSQQPILRGEIGQWKGVRFVETPNDKYGLNPAVLYNVGEINKQYGITAAIASGDGCPDPETTAVDGIWYIGQKDQTHYIQLEDFASGDFAIGDVVTIHTKVSSTYGVSNGVDPLDTTAIVRKVVAVDATNNRLSFDRPIMKAYATGASATSVSGGTATFYGFVTKARHVGFILVMGSTGGVQGRSYQPIQFYNPRPVDKQNCPASEQSDDENFENCWNTLKPGDQIAVGNDKREGLKTAWIVTLN